jgi:hypothetical protein
VLRIACGAKWLVGISIFGFVYELNFDRSQEVSMLVVLRIMPGFSMFIVDAVNVRQGTLMDGWAVVCWFGAGRGTGNAVCVLFFHLAKHTFVVFVASSACGALSF